MPDEPEEERWIPAGSLIAELRAMWQQACADHQRRGTDELRRVDLETMELNVRDMQARHDGRISREAGPTLPA